MGLLGVAAVTAVASVFFSELGGYFAKDACDRLEVALGRSVVGQALATEELVDAICEHIKQGEKTTKPLVISLHGPPVACRQEEEDSSKILGLSGMAIAGVGKSFAHMIVARALYGLDGGPQSLQQSVKATVSKSSEILGKNLQGLRAPAELVKTMTSMDCPGRGCPGYKVLYGLDFLSGDKDMHFHYFREALIKHARNYREALLVVEEYDKLTCDARTVMRQLLQHPEVANVTMRQSIVLLESNLGMFELQNLLHKHNFQQGKISAEEAHHMLKTLIYEHWASSCEPTIDTINALNLVDFFVPFFPLGRKEIRELIDGKLQAWAGDHKLSKLTWDANVPEFLLNKVHFHDNYPVDGARDVDSVLTRHVARAIRNLARVQNSGQDPSLVGSRIGVHLRINRSASDGQSLQASYL